MRLGAIFIAACMVLIAGSAGAVAFLVLGFTMAEAAVVAVAVLTALALYKSVSTLLGVRTVVGPQISDLARGNADMARQVAEIGHSLTALEKRVESALDKTRAATDPLAVEIGELGTLVRQLAETAAVHEIRLFELKAAAVSNAPACAPVETTTAPEPAPGPAGESDTKPETKSDDAADSKADAKPAAADTLLATIDAAIDANRIDLYLQPIVTLPQRKVRYYEAMSRLRTDKGEALQAGAFIASAEAGGLMPKIDNLVVFRCVQVVRRLLLKNREVGLFCNLSTTTLTDPAIFPHLLEFLDANRAIAPSLVLEFTQSAWRSAGPMENEGLAALAERGFRFSLDNVSDLRIEAQELATRGFRFIKIPANLLLNRAAGTTTDIHPADLADLLGRFGIDLIADKIESEGAVVDLLDYDVRFGQGFLFSPPRPVRAEALQGIAERGDVIARDAAEGDPTAGAASAQAPEGEAGNGKRLSALAQLARRI